MYRTGDHLLIQFPDRAMILPFFANHISQRCGPVYSLLMLLFIIPLVASAEFAALCLCFGARAAVIDEGDCFSGARPLADLS
jgi:hypothetical protein